jgi:hypothetical protein
MQTQEKQHKGYLITWVEPPVSLAEWVLSVSHNVRGKLGRMAVFTAPTFQQAMDEAEKFIDEQAAAHPRIQDRFMISNEPQRSANRPPAISTDRLGTYQCHRTLPLPIAWPDDASHDHTSTTKSQTLTAAATTSLSSSGRPGVRGPTR